MKIIFYSGKGGVGKSTLAAATAWQLSKKHRVLITSLDPAHNLGDIFCAVLKDKKTRFTENLYLSEVDLQKRSRDYLQREVNVLSETYRYLQALNLDDYFSVLKYSPGIEEYALLTAIEETIRKEKDFEYIVFDTPPTGLTLRFLALPKVTITWVERLMQIRRKILEKRYTIQKIRGEMKEGQKNPEIRLKYDEGDDDILKRLKTLHQNYLALNAILQGKDCSIVLVFNPDMLALKESERLIEGLRELNLPLRLLIDNKVTEENREMAGRVEIILREKHGDDIPVKQVALSTAVACAQGNGLYDIPEDLASLV
jgi:arsenite/tail-anchored protein-transporting ATPase